MLKIFLRAFFIEFFFKKMSFMNALNHIFFKEFFLIFKSIEIRTLDIIL